MKKNNLAVAKTPSVEPSEFIGKSGYYLNVKDNFEGNSDLGSIIVEKGISKGFLDGGLYCLSNDGQKEKWFPTVYSALQEADDVEEYSLRKPSKISLSDEILGSFIEYNWYEIAKKEYKKQLEKSLQCIFEANLIKHNQVGGLMCVDTIFDLLEMFLEEQNCEIYNKKLVKSVEDIFELYTIKKSREENTKKLLEKEEKDATDVNPTPQCNAFQPIQPLINMSQENKDAFEKLMKTL